MSWHSAYRISLIIVVRSDEGMCFLELRHSADRISLIIIVRSDEGMCVPEIVVQCGLWAHCRPIYRCS